MTIECSASVGLFRTACRFLVVGIVAGGALFGGAEPNEARRFAVGNETRAAAAVTSVASADTSALALLHSAGTDNSGVGAEVPRAARDFDAADRTSAVAPADAAAASATSPFAPSGRIRVAASRAKKKVVAEPTGFTILQIGDSHTAADYFTGEVRKILQARYGNGGVGYVDVGRPHPGVRSAVLKITATPGWTYTGLQKAGESSAFFLSGFDATASRGGESVTFTASEPVPYDRIEIEVATGPDFGTIDIAVDNLAPVQRSLSTPESDRLVFRITPEHRKTDKVRRLTITALEDRPVTISSVGIFNKGRGLSYSNIGFPGATIDIVNKYDPKMLDDELKRLAPQIVVLAFGTNEGFNDDLDLEQYRSRYRNVIRKIRASLPLGQIVMVGPPRADRVAAHCVKDPQSAACQASRGETELDQPRDCPYQTPPRLDQVRRIQRDLAEQENIPFWDWSGIMPSRCGAHSWAMASPRLMAPDHVHFTPEGYRVSASAFAAFLSPIVSQMRHQEYALSDD